MSGGDSVEASSPIGRFWAESFLATPASTSSRERCRGRSESLLADARSRTPPGSAAKAVSLQEVATNQKSVLEEEGQEEPL